MILYRRCACNPADDCSHPWHYKFEHNTQRYRGSTHLTNRRRAELVAIRQRVALIDQQAGAAMKTAPRLSKHIADYLTFAREDHPATADTKDRRVLAAFLAVIGDKRLDQVSPFDGERWRTQRAQVTGRGRLLSRATINRELNVVLGCLSKTVEWRRLTRSPFAELKPWNTDEIPIRPLSPEQRALILQQFPPELALICRVTLEALLRLSEVLGLTRDDLKPEGLQRRLKGGTVKTISVTPTLLADLRACLRTPTQVHVFGDPPPSQQATSVRFTRAFRAVGLHGISHHTMRHTGVTDMLEDGVNPRAIQELAGWTSLRMLERYGHVRDAETRRAVAGTAARNAAALAHAIAGQATGAVAADPATKTATRESAILVSVASPTVPSWNQILAFLKQMAELREIAGSAA